MSKTSIFTTITPLPQGITRQSVMDTYHNHIEMIELNPLVVERFKCKPPSYAPPDEFYSTWYTIKDKVSYLPGGLASGSVSYHAVFNDLPDGLQTHVYAPLGLDIQAKWSIGGSLPGEPKQPSEEGVNVPRQGLYIREQVKMKCNIMMMSFVKKTFKDSHAKLVDRLVEKAHIIESNAANMRLKALRQVDPGERMGHGDIFIAPPPDYQPEAAPEYTSMRSNSSSYGSPHSPGLSQSSTITSQSSFATSPVYHPTDLRVSLFPHEKSTQDFSLLPSTTYNPSARRASPPPTEYKDYKDYKDYKEYKDSPQDLSPMHSYPPTIDFKDSSYMYNAMYHAVCAGPPCEGPPVPPKDNVRC